MRRKPSATQALITAKHLAGLSMDEMDSGAGRAIDGPVITAGIILLRNVLQPVLDVHAGIGAFENYVPTHEG
jgi:hypothetical protein